MAKKLWGGRFTGETDPLMEQFNASIGFDRASGTSIYAEARLMRERSARLAFLRQAMLMPLSPVWHK